MSLPPRLRSFKDLLKNNFHDEMIKVVSATLLKAPAELQSRISETLIGLIQDGQLRSAKITADGGSDSGPDPGEGPSLDEIYNSG